MKKYKSNSITIKNAKNINKPNEDFYLCDDKNGIYLLVDGVSRDKINGIYPNPSPAADVSRLFVESAYQFMVNFDDNNTDILQTLYNAIEIGNQKINQYNIKKEWDNDFLPGTVGIILILRCDKLFYAYIGDCYGVVINDEKHIFTECQTQKIAAHNKEFSAFEIRNRICNNSRHPYAYGVLNGDKHAMDFVRYGSMNIHKNDKIFICSDGFADIIKNFRSIELGRMTIEQMVKESKETDDKTMIIIEEEMNETEDN